jgi:hypothetical protein
VFAIANILESKIIKTRDARQKPKRDWKIAAKRMGNNCFE